MKRRRVLRLITGLLLLGAAVAFDVLPLPGTPVAQAQSSSACVQLNGTWYTATDNGDGTWRLSGSGPYNGLNMPTPDLRTAQGSPNSQASGTQSGSGSGHPNTGNPLNTILGFLGGAVLGGLGGFAAAGPPGAVFGAVVGGLVGGAMVSGAGAGCTPPPCLGCNLQPPRPPIYAPDLYLYPLRPTRVHVALRGTLTASRPAYGNGWTVQAAPRGTLLAGGARYGHLFYEAAAAEPWQTARGWVVPAAGWDAWMAAELPRLGLNTREAADFARDWSADLPPARAYLIAPQPQALIAQAVGLRITPAPQTLYRLWLYIVPLPAPVAVAPPQVSPPVRRGFTAVEWGVLFPPGVTPPCAPELTCPA